ncbi:MAG: hydrogenase [Spirochaetes bacterium GWD1_61_31]|nr:MAG: hydrogenase [Spirochaetes bacterium GWB1_60_80]OHD29423.1 MAG: hydrogenase [Spirochaetes bacterium GWC1_61_12]OHD35430.1 MAG: hydrogenase [Spirochaetes bacterium GWD1_61_31]OHD44939.1 MAG: hydrogenase [Spirochaetes bacterium GWE1_60_18]OHD60049.1 MAG: hydrogenase [Spirochaetes bacterium GWF1_60_12]HAP43609.1 hydrogenase [Spirochaetaceae bacterium]
MNKRLDVLICGGGACISSHSHELKKSLLRAIEDKGLTEEINVVETGCMGPCELGPVMVVYPDGSFYINLKEEDAPRIVEEHFLKGRPVHELLWLAPEARKIVEQKKQIPFFEKQKKIVLANCGRIDPDNIEEYIGQRGYEALGTVLTTMKPQEVADAVERSGLRGRGGAGFPTGTKWKMALQNAADQKYLLCNADEGDPGAFMDRAVLEGDPHTVIEGMAIGGYAIGASKGYVYVRAEYPLAIERLTVAIKQARAYGMLGDNIFETGFKFDLAVRIGAGAFVCGEETALIASVEGKRGQPRPKPPFPAQKGLWGKPTIINNVETLATIRHIFNNGVDWFASIGTEKSKGTKVFALSGKVVNSGLVEVPMGITLGELVFDIGGGIPNGKAFKAVQTGGPSGGCIPAKFLNTPIDYESLKQLGSIMGSGGLIVLDEDSCMVNMAKYFLEFSLEESCGQCVPCRVGLKHMHSLLEKITNGQGTMEDLEKLESLAYTVRASSLCGLGQAAPNPVISTLKYFKHEYIEHIQNKKCSPGVCAALYNAPCENACPANVDAAAYISYMGDGKLMEAYFKHMEHNPFPIVCARVCPAFCEKKCARGKYDQEIAIREVKRLFADWAIDQGMGFTPPKKPKKERVAVIGAGPAGLACAFYLTRLGYLPVVFEALPVAGGMMKVGIPDYRLPKDKLEAEISVIERAGVEIRLGAPVDSIEALMAQGFQAVFVGTGAHQAQPLSIDGSELPGVISGIDFLRKVNLGETFDVGADVVVVGGGSTAMDAARTAKRLGAHNVRIVYRRTRTEMPAQLDEVVDAEEEGIEMDFLANPLRVVEANGKVSAIRCIKTELGDFDDSGRRRPVPVSGSEYNIRANLIIPCLGQKLSLGLTGGKLNLDRRGHIAVDPLSGATNLPGVFAGGDAINPSTVIESVAQGRLAASHIDKFFGYEGKLFDRARQPVVVAYDEEAYLKTLPRHLPHLERAESRITKMAMEVNRGLSLEEAIEEARRCLHCDRNQPAALKPAAASAPRIEDML